MQFGEIVEPSSRALWEPDSDDDTDLIDIKWSKESSPPSHIKNLIIFEGKIAVDYGNNCTASEVAVAKLSGVNVSIYHLAGDIVVCNCDGHVEGYGGKVAEFLIPWIEKSEKITAIQTLARTKHIGFNSDETYLLRSLYTAKANQKYGQVLEQPNMLTGVTAGVLSYCEFKDLPASAWCLYSSSPYSGTDSTAVKPIDDLLCNLKIPLFKSSFIQKPSVSSSLYM